MQPVTTASCVVWSGTRNVCLATTNCWASEPTWSGAQTSTTVDSGSRCSKCLNYAARSFNA